MGGGMQFRQIEDEHDLGENVGRINELIHWLTRVNVGLLTRDVLDSIALKMASQRLDLSKLITKPIQAMVDQLQQSDTEFEKLLHADTRTRKQRHNKLLGEFEAHLEIVAAMNECAEECTSKQIPQIVSEKRDKESCETLRRIVESYRSAQHFSMECDDDHDDDDDEDLPADYLKREQYQESQMRMMRSMMREELELARRQPPPIAQQEGTTVIEEHKTLTMHTTTAVGSLPGAPQGAKPQQERPRISRDESWRKDPSIGGGLPELEESPVKSSHVHVAAVTQRITASPTPQHQPHRRQSRHLDLPGCD